MRFFPCVALACALAASAAAEDRTDLYGDPLPPGARARLGTLRLRGSQWIAFSPDGRTLAAASGGGLPHVRLWNVANGSLRETLDSGAGVVEFSPDGRLLALSSWSKVVLRDVAAHLEIRTIERNSSSHGELEVAFSPDGRTLLVGEDGPAGTAGIAQGTVVRFLDVSTGQELRREPRLKDSTSAALADSVTRARIAALTEPVLGFSNDFSSAVLWDYQKDGSIRLRDLSQGRDRWRVPLTWDDFRYTQPKAAFSPDGRTVAVSAHADVLLIDVASGHEIRRIQLDEGYVTCLRYSPNGSLLATAVSGGVISLWDGQTGAPVLSLPTHTRGTRALAFSPDGLQVVSGGGTARVWDAQKGRELHRVGRVGHGVESVGLSTQMRAIVTGGWNELHVFDLDTGAERAAVAHAHEGYVQGVRVFPDGRTAVTAGYHDPVLRFWDLATGRRTLQLDPVGGTGPIAFSRRGAAVVATYGGSPSDVLLSRDGSTLVSIFPGDLRVWTRESSAPATWRGRRLTGDPLSSVALSADGRVLATRMVTKTDQYGDQGPVRLWDAMQGKRLLEIEPKGRVSTLALSSDGNLLAWQADGAVLEIYDVRQRRTVGRAPSPEHELIHSIAFSPDDSTLASGYTNGLIYLWDVAELRRADAAAR